MDKYVLNREEAILLIIDIQEKLVPAMSCNDKVINNTKILIAGANQMDIPIIYTEQYPKGLGRTIEELEVEIENGQLFEKNSFTAFTNEVRDALKSNGKKKVIIAGMETHVCVYQTVRDLLASCYEVFVIKDAVASRTEMNYLNGLDLMASMGAVITNTETVIFDLLKISGTPEFKILSKMIK